MTLLLLVSTKAMTVNGAYSVIPVHVLLKTHVDCIVSLPLVEFSNDSLYFVKKIKKTFFVFLCETRPSGQLCGSCPILVNRKNSVHLTRTSPLPGKSYFSVQNLFSGLGLGQGLGLELGLGLGLWLGLRLWLVMARVSELVM